MTEIHEVRGTGEKRSLNLRALLEPTSAKRTLFYLAGDALTVAIAGVLLARLMPGKGDLAGVFFLSLALLASQAALNFLLSVYSIRWSTFSLSDIPHSCAGALAVSFALAVLARLGIALPGLSLSLALVWGLVDVSGTIAVHISNRFYEEVLRRRRGKRALLVVCSERSYFLLDALRRIPSTDYRFIGFVDPAPVSRGSISQGLPVLGSTDEIEQVVRKFDIATVFVFLSNRQSFALGEFYQRLERLGVEVKTMPSLVDLLNDRADVGALERLAIHELTGRPPVEVNVPEMQRVFGGKRILVTGAGGSIGSELCRQLARFSPAALVLFERDDSNLFYIEHELRNAHPGLELAPFLGDVTREEDVNRIFRKTEPNVVFHAAAYKHVPILEFHPEDAIRVNVLGSHLVARAAVRSGADCFVYVSTDKAVNPTSVMGASKRIGEMVTTSMNGLGDVRFCAVRFGNVLDSRGSVSTIFREAITKRQPVRITDPEMRRYFMLIDEAVLLVMQAVAMSRGGEVFVLDMGQPVRITDLADTMIRNAGLIPNRDVPIVFSGRRPGEKLFEELLTAEEGTIATGNQRIYRARISRQHCYPDVLEGLHALSDVTASGDNEKIRRQILQTVGSYQSDSTALSMNPTACGTPAMQLTDAGLHASLTASPHPADKPQRQHPAVLKLGESGSGGQPEPQFLSRMAKTQGRIQYEDTTGRMTKDE
jgi:FlaA1/EpsC-like NDP-sugar epimerase